MAFPDDVVSDIIQSIYQIFQVVRFAVYLIHLLNQRTSELSFSASKFLYEKEIYSTANGVFLHNCYFSPHM